MITQNGGLINRLAPQGQRLGFERFHGFLGVTPIASSFINATTA